MTHPVYAEACEMNCMFQNCIVAKLQIYLSIIVLVLIKKIATYNFKTFIWLY